MLFVSSIGGSTGPLFVDDSVQCFDSHLAVLVIVAGERRRSVDFLGWFLRYKSSITC